MRTYRIISLLTLSLIVLSTYAENGMNSPYTRYGFGQLATMETGTSKSMGGTGIGMRNSSQINLLNPASYASVDTLTFLFDAGVSLHNTNFTEGDTRMNARNTTFDYLAMQFRLLPKLGMTMSMMPFSNIGYNFSNTQTIRDDEEGLVTTTNRYYGDGGLRQVTAGLGWSPFKGFSVGGNVSYLYGEVYHYIYNQYNESSISTRTKQYIADITTYNINLGVQYGFVSGKNRFTLGATYQPGHAIDDKAYTIELSSLGNSSATSDTTNISSLSIPTSYGIGLSYVYDERLTIAADYSVQQYSTCTFFGHKGADMHRASIGLEFIPERITRNLFRRARYRAGLHHATSYYHIGNHKGPSEYGVTIGIGLPIMNRWNGKSVVNISGQAVHLRPAPESNMITENYLRLSIGIAFNETWFDKWKVQ